MLIFHVEEVSLEGKDCVEDSIRHMVATPDSKPRQQAPEPQPCCRGHCSGLGVTPLCSLISLVTRMTCELGHILTLQGALIVRDCLPRPHSFLLCMPPCLTPGLWHSLCPALLAVPLYIIRDWITKLIFHKMLH